MKRALFTLVLLALLPVMALADGVDNARAQQAAKTFLNNNGAEATQLVDLTAAAGFSHLYIFNADHGFVIVAADDRVQPILGYSLTGAFTADDMPDNVRGWLQGYDDAIRWAIDNDVRASSETARQWHDLERGVKGTRAEVMVGPLIQTRWDQPSPYNLQCPKVNGASTYTGCVATAMAQVMKYWNYPSMGIGSHAYSWNGQTLSVDFGATNYDWTNMTNNYDGTSTQVQKQAVATLMYHCGVSVEMNYGTGGSGAVTARVADALKAFFNYSPSIVHRNRSDYADDTWIAMLKEDLDQLHPIQYHGTGSGGGHSFVCDGYDDSDYFHFNWGWSGNCDAYYTINNLNPGPGGSGSGAYGIYNNGQGAIFGIQPIECAASDPTSLTYTTSGLQGVTLNWSAASGAVSYNIYRNNDYVGTTTTNTYSETAPFGTNIYYVRSVDANGDLSFASNRVAVTVACQTPIVDDLEASVEGDDIQLTWTAPEWCFPETATATLTYGTQIPISSYFTWEDNIVYWGHRYLSENISSYNGMRLYSVELYVSNAGPYEVCVFEGSTTSGGYSIPVAQVATSSFTAALPGWRTVSFEEPIIIDGTQDLWVFVHNPGSITNLTSFLCNAEGDKGCYYSSNPLSYTYNNASGLAFLLKTYLTDGVYTYNLYRNDVAVESHLASTSYTDSNLPVGLYNYYVKTNYYAGESAASNTVSLELAESNVALVQGWNWWAPTLDVSLDALKQGLGANGILINSQNSGFLRYEDGQWSGMLNALVPGQMYRIQTGNSCSFTMRGTPVTDVQVSIVPGYNWFGYTGTQSLPLENLNISPAEGDKIISQNDGFAIYNGTSWEGTLGALQPGRGYVYLSTAQETKTMSF